MRVMGVDPSSAKSAWAIVVDGVAEGVGLWKPPSKMKKQPEKLLSWGQYMQWTLATQRPEVVIIEEVGRPPQGNFKVMRTLVRFEAIAQYECLKLGIDFMLVAVPACRLEVFGDGKTGKVTAFEAMRDKHPQFEWPDMEKGGDDISDALVMGYAGEALLRRR